MSAPNDDRDEHPSDQPPDEAGHPTLVAALLMIGVVALLVFLAWVSTF